VDALKARDPARTGEHMLLAGLGAGGMVQVYLGPDDFQAHFESKTYPAISVTNDPGDWTAVLYHVKGNPTDYESFGCTGFRVE
jgi:hypothetical protein